MRPRMQITGLTAVRTELRNLSERVTTSARRTMYKSADQIVKLARDYAPEDTSNMVNGIQVIKDYAGANGRLQIDIGIKMPPDAFSASGTPLTETQFDQYVTLVHENYESIVAPNGPGRRTRAKMLANPGKVGRRFLARAAEEEEPKLEQKTIAAITKTIKEVQG